MIGKHGMFRSNKAKVIKEKKKEKIDQKTIDYKTFLGDISHLLLAE